MHEKNVRIIISGTAGSGKTTIAKCLSNKLNCPYFSAGEFIRNHAKDNLMSIEEYMSAVEEDPSLDYRLNAIFTMFALEFESFVMDYRLGFLFSPKPFSVFLKVSNNIAAQRLLSEKKIGELKTNIDSPIDYVVNRNENLNNRLRSRFFVDFEDEDHYHLVVNTDSAQPDCIADSIIKRFKIQKDKLGNP